MVLSRFLYMYDYPSCVARHPKVQSEVWQGVGGVREEGPVPVYSSKYDSVNAAHMLIRCQYVI